MSRFTSLYLLAFSLLTLSACGSLEMAHPDGPTPVNPPGTPSTGGGKSKVEGTWSFVGATNYSVATSSQQGMTAVMTCSYKTVDNQGDIIFDGKNMTAKNLGYILDGSIRSVLSEGSTVLNDMTMPLGMALPPYNSSAPYKQLDDNTIYMEKGFIQDVSGMIGTESTGGAAKISWSGDTLVLTVDLAQVNAPGTKLSGSQVVKCVKK
ncbi:hypothetical protein FHW36_103427 [Chitinophaga polysaccharea]|uniref:Lipocalin-like protein n=1 Tax=Chitinophaga polysaccharea TaxID=1293035 RepID=A0A561PU26_9BACT|nr:hypothetical protein [Chitinophaga polysaccharea]TWF41623.1 hypothetical protein FHW36_103427 [Chitinophaga polysaccharea]